MSKVALKLNKGTFISYNEKYRNFSRSNYLLIRNCDNRYCKLDILKSLIKFNLDKAIPEGSIIECAKLNLPIEDWKQCSERYYNYLNIYINQEPFEESCVNWQNRPRVKLYKTIKLSYEELEDEYISIDLTSLVNDWISGNIPNNGITLGLESKDIKLSLLKRNREVDSSTNLVINYTSKPTEKKSIAIQVQFFDLGGKILKRNEEDLVML
ncbi:DNRLRE domain-containing protein [Clostridium cylindrosporum]|uniref:Carbohydrate-binding module family 96 domain-containing protein n=1 Tax=Clostridium cylindrosporum DSM 605 TaxID=1121307 RepID=A0A0J8G548_CLOCY|nr:DNRLRE domain-containing protein [Clostridium cylindrosporum]KMT22791.1 hypothetical protein CLCY_5c00300 [Clostridium cylindrosporum DSM 605]